MKAKNISISGLIPSESGSSLLVFTEEKEAFYDSLQQQFKIIYLTCGGETNPRITSVFSRGNPRTLEIIPICYVCANDEYEKQLRKAHIVTAKRKALGERVKRYIPRIAIYRCGCSEKFRTEIGKTEGYIFMFWHNGPDGTTESRCPNHKESLAILSNHGYFKTSEWIITDGALIDNPFARLSAALLEDDECAVEYR